MNGKLSGRMAAPLIAACVALASCNANTTNTPGPTTAFSVLRLTTSGVPDTTFAAPRGIVTTDVDPALFDFALAVALQPVDADPLHNKILAAGSSGLAGQGVIALVRYNPDGTLDAGFGISGIVRTPTPAGLTSASATAMTVQPDGNILVAALSFTASTGKTGIVLLRYNANGALDTTGFGAPNGFVTATIGPGLVSDTCGLALQGDGKIVVAGATQSGDIILYRYSGAGVLDTASFGTTGSGGSSVKNIGTLARSPALALQSSGKIIVATGNDVDQVVLRFGTDGQLDTTFGNAGIVTTDIGPGSINFGNAVVVQSNDKIVVAGHAKVEFSNDASDISLVRYTVDGALDATSFLGPTNNPNPAGIVTTDLNKKFDNALSVALQDQFPNEPKIIVSGNTGSAGFTQTAVLRYNPDGTLDTSFGPTNEGVVLVQVGGPSNIASGNAVALEAIAAGVGIVVAGYD